MTSRLGYKSEKKKFQNAHWLRTRQCFQSNEKI